MYSSKLVMHLKLVLLCYIATISSSLIIPKSVEDLIIENEGKVIVGGQNATWREYYYHVSIQQEYFNGMHHRCDGVLINESWVLSSAHCTSPLYTDLYIKADPNPGETSSAYDQTSRVEKIVYHPNYSNSKKTGDLALLKVEKPFRFSGYIKIAKLATRATIIDGVNLTVSGWGAGSANLTLRYPQKVLNVTSISNESCKKHIESLVRGPIILGSDVLCAGEFTGGTAVCNEATGAPMVVNNDTVVGIFSWGLYPCAKETGLGVYTRISNYTDWINSTILHN